MHRLRPVPGAPAKLTPAIARDIVGGLSKPSKMPGWAYGLPAKECKTGSTLHKLSGTVCSDCYALKGMYRFNNVQAAQYKRLESLKDPRWVDAMVFLINRLKEKYFRWHDSGDIQSPNHLDMIVQVARRCPDVNFWLPTREKVFLYSWLQRGQPLPSNLVVRLSATNVDGPPPVGFAHTSTVSTTAPTCPAYRQNNHCGTCRACWDPGTANVAYKKH